MNRNTLYVLPAGVCLALVSACGGTSDAAQTPTTVTVTKPAVTVTDEVTVETVPQSCLDALDAADTIAGDTGAFGQIMVDMITQFPKAVRAAFNRDAAAINAATTRQEGINTRLGNLTDRMAPHIDTYRAARDECQASAQ
jgi:hypothetical protein